MFIFLKNAQLRYCKNAMDSINLMPIIYCITIAAKTGQDKGFLSGFNCLQGFFML